MRNLLRLIAGGGLAALCWLLPGAQPAAAQDAAAAPIVVQIAAATQAQVNALAAQVDVWAVDHARAAVTAAVDAATLTNLRAAGYSVEVDAARTARMAALSAQARAAGAPVGTITGFACYRTVEQTYADMAALAAAHPTLARWVDYGDSWEKQQPGGAAGYDLHALVLTNRARPGPKFPFVIIAAIHARELAPGEIAARFAEELVNGYGEDPTITWLLDYGALHIVPLANPDGRKFAEQLIYWRKNTHDDNACVGPPSLYTSYGVDLNRNSSFGWGACTDAGCSSTYSCSMVFRGAAAASEPETQALETYLASVFADQRGPALTDPAPADTTGLFITLHSYGQLVLYPWGFSADPAPNAAALATLGAGLGARTGYTVCQSGAPGCLYATDGTTDDFTYGTRGVASYTIEMGSDFFESCNAFENAIRPALADALRYGFTAARRPYTTPGGPATLEATLAPTRVVQGGALTLSVRLGAGSAPPGQAITATLASAALWLDQPPWLGGAGTPLLPTDGAFDTITETVTATLDTSAWTLGRHTLFWTGVNAAGAAGIPGAAFIDVVSEPTADPETPEPDAVRVFLPVGVQGVAP